MKYEIGKTFVGSTEKLEIKILSFLPGAQVIGSEQINKYNITINGNRTVINESVLDLLIKEKEK